MDGRTNGRMDRQTDGWIERKENMENMTQVSISFRDIYNLFKKSFSCVCAVPDPRGKRGHMPPPPKRPQGIPCPQKNKLIIDLMTPKASCKKMVPVRVANSNLIPTQLQSVKMVGHW